VAIRTGRLTDAASRTAAGLALAVLLVVTVAALATQTAFRDADHRADIAAANSDVVQVKSRIESVTALADELAAAAGVLMPKAGGNPAVAVSGVATRPAPGGVGVLLRDPAHDLFRTPGEAAPPR